MASKAGCVLYDLDDRDAEMLSTYVFVCMFGKGGHNSPSLSMGCLLYLKVLPFCGST